MSLTPYQERWAEALALLRIHGAEAPLFLAERVAILARAGDTAGVERLKEIAVRLDQLTSGTVQ